MPSRPTEAHRKDLSRVKTFHKPPQFPAHHGKRKADDAGQEGPLLRIPSESLTHITSYLDPPTLLTLAQTNRYLSAHVRDDNTWRRAYVYQFLGITPENDLRDDVERRSLLLRRVENTWRREFVLRYSLKRRWERSRNQTVAHIPHHSPVSAMHLMLPATLLTSSLHYGIVARSNPFTGGVLRGYLDAAGTANGVGIGNPNAEFSPHVTAIAITSEGLTAKVLWGFRNGEVAVTTAARAADGTRPAAAVHMRCTVDDAHDGAVLAVACAAGEGPNSNLLVTGAADGRVKIWDARSVRCLWTADKGPALVPDPCMKVAIDAAGGVVACGTASGEIVVWSGFGSFEPRLLADLRSAVREVRVSAIEPMNAAPTAPSIRELAQLHLMASNEGGYSLLVSYRDDRHLYRLNIHLGSSVVERIAFGGDSSGLHTVHPEIATRDGESSFIISGDTLGSISIFDWDARPSDGCSSIVPRRRVDAHSDGAITALAWNQVVLVSGSAGGTIKVWDSLTLELLREFSLPAARPVARSVTDGDMDGIRRILLDRDVLVASMGSRVMAWKAGPVPVSDKNHAKRKHARYNKHSAPAKWQQQIEMHREIAESRRDIEEEQTYTRHAFGRAREQQSTLAHLGLNEVEAVEYVLMLSRDEEEQRRQDALVSASQNREDEGVFMNDFDDATPIRENATHVNARSVSPTRSGASTPSTNVSLHRSGRSIPRTMPPLANGKIQISPRIRPEPTEAGDGANYGPSSSCNSHSRISPPATSDLKQFPSVSRSASSGASVSSTPNSSLMAGNSAVGSPQSARSAWSTPLRSRRPSSSVSLAPQISPPPSARQRNSPDNSIPASESSLLTVELARQRREQEEEDLRFAIELSLAEARSRGDNV